MKYVKLDDSSFMKQLFNEMRDLLLKYYYGIDGKFSLQVLQMEQTECEQLLHKYRGEKSCFVNGMCRAINQFIAHRYSDSLKSTPQTVVAASRSSNINEVYDSLPKFFDVLWQFFCKHINGYKGYGIWTQEDWENMAGGCLKQEFKEFKFMNDFWYGFHLMAILSIVDWVEERHNESKATQNMQSA